MRAVQVTSTGLVLQDVPVPEPGPGEVLVQVAGAGLCHSDCLIRDAPSVYRPDGAAFTLGHETAGTVAAVGVGVQALSAGQPVVVHSEYGCGQCGVCRSGHERYCPAIAPCRGAGLGFDGGMAEYVLVPRAGAVVPLPEGIDPVDAGPLDDAGLTPYHAIRTSMPWLEAGAVAVVIGVGGLGHLAVQLLRVMTPATIVAVEPDEARRAFALELGADVALHPDDDAGARVKAMGVDGASLVLDLVGTDATLGLGVAAVATRGKVVCAGAGLGSHPFSMLTTPWECVLQTTYSGEAWELEQLLTLVATGAIRVRTHRITLDDVPGAYARLDRGEHGLGRLVAVPSP
ncbi:MAG: alcohol dehydrogenase catalytic domain-containing protein [Actinomycetota bacterium]